MRHCNIVQAICTLSVFVLLYVIQALHPRASGHIGGGPELRIDIGEGKHEVASHHGNMPFVEHGSNNLDPHIHPTNTSTRTSENCVALHRQVQAHANKCQAQGDPGTGRQLFAKKKKRKDEEVLCVLILRGLAGEKRRVSQPGHPIYFQVFCSTQRSTQ